MQLNTFNLNTIAKNTQFLKTVNTTPISKNPIKFNVVEKTPLITKAFSTIPTTTTQLPYQVLYKAQEARESLPEPWAQKYLQNRFKQLNYKPPKNYYTDRNNPHQINSLTDVIWDSIFFWKDNGLEQSTKLGKTFSKIPLLNGITNTLDFAWSNYIDPAIHGEFGAFSINLFNDVMEDLDILANPVKGLVLGGGEGFLKSIGAADGAGRANYDYDTGSFVTDLALEIISDPGTYVGMIFSYGSSAGASAGSKALFSTLKEVTEEVVTESGEHITKKVFKEVLEEATEKSLKNTLEASLKNVKEISEEVLQRTANKTLSDDAIKLGDKVLNGMSSFKNADDSTKQMLKTIAYDKADNMLKFRNDPMSERWLKKVITGANKLYISGEATNYADALKASAKKMLQSENSLSHRLLNSVTRVPTIGQNREALFKAFTDSVNAAGDSIKAYKVIDALSKVYKPLKTIDDIPSYIVKYGVGGASGLYPVFKTTQGVSKGIKKAISNSWFRRLTPYLKSTTKTLDIFQYDAIKYAAAKSNVQNVLEQDIIKGLPLFSKRSTQSALEVAIYTDLVKIKQIFQEAKDLETLEKKLRELLDPNKVVDEDTPIFLAYKEQLERINRENADRYKEPLDILNNYEQYYKNYEELNDIEYTLKKIDDIVQSNSAQAEIRYTADVVLALGDVDIAADLISKGAFDKNTLLDVLSTLFFDNKVSVQDVLDYINKYNAMLDGATSAIKNFPNIKITEDEWERALNKYVTKHIDELKETYKENLLKLRDVFNTETLLSDLETTSFKNLEDFDKFKQKFDNAVNMYKQSLEKTQQELEDKLVPAYDALTKKDTALQDGLINSLKKFYKKYNLYETNGKLTTELDANNFFKKYFKENEEIINTIFKESINSTAFEYAIEYAIINTKNHALEDALQRLASYKNITLKNYKEVLTDLNKTIPMLKKEQLKARRAEGSLKSLRSASDATMAHDVLIKDLDTLQQALAKLEVNEPIDVLRLEADQVSRVLKLENLETQRLLEQTTGFTELITQFKNNMLIKHLLELDPNSDEQLKPVLEAVHKINAIIEGYYKKQALFDALKGLDVSEPEYLAITSALAYYNDANPAKFENAPWLWSELIERIEKYTYTRNMKVPLDLESIGKLELKGGGTVESTLNKTLIPENAGQHTGAYDVLLLEEALKTNPEGMFDELQDVLKDENTVVVIADLESGGFYKDLHAIHDVSLHIYDSSEKVDTFLLSANSKDFKNKINRGAMTLTGSEADFIKAHANGYSSEKELLQAMLARLDSIKEANPGKEIALVFHNGDNFDIPFIKTRLTQYELNRFDFDHIKTYDTLKSARKANGYIELNPEVREKLIALVEHYAQQRVELGLPYFMSAITSDLTRACEAFEAYLDDLFESLSSQTHVASEATEALKKHMDDAVSLDYMKAFKESLSITRNNMITTLSSVKKANKQLSDVRFLDTDLQTEDFIQQLIKVAEDNPKLFKEVFKLNDEIDFEVFLREKLGTSPNTTAVLNLFNPTEVSRYGFTNRKDNDIIGRFINPKTSLPYSSGDYLSKLDADSYDKVAKAISRVESNLHNIEPLKDLQEDMRKLLRYLLENKEFKTKGVKYLNADYPRSVSELYATLHYVLKNVKEKRVAKNFVKDWSPDEFVLHVGVSKDLIDFLTDPKKTNVLFRTEWTHATRLKHKAKAYKHSALNISDKFTQKPLRRMFSKVFRKNTQGTIQNIVDAFGDRLGFKAVSTTALCTDTADALDAWTDFLDTIPKKKLQHTIRAFEKYTSTYGEQQLQQVLTLMIDDTGALPNVDNILSYLVYKTPQRYVTFDIATATSNEATYKALETLYNNKPLLKQHGIEFVLTEDGRRAYIVLTKDTTVNFVKDSDTKLFKAFIGSTEIKDITLKDLDLNYGIDEAHREIIANFIRARQSLHAITENASVGTINGVFTPDDLKVRYELLPESVRSLLPTSETLEQSPLFTRTVYDHSNLGATTARREIDMYVPNDFISTLAQSTQASVEQASDMTRLMALYYDNNLSINRGFLESVPDEDIRAFFKTHQDYVLTALVEDKKYGYKAVKINPFNKSAIAEARRLEAVILPDETYRTLSKVINENILDNKSLGFFNRLVYAYKTGYLVLSPGVIMRNLIDGILKNLATTQDPKVLQDTIVAADLWRRYSQASEEILKMHNSGLSFEESMSVYFKKTNSSLTKEEYDFVDKFSRTSASASLSPGFKKYYIEKNTEHLKDTIPTAQDYKKFLEQNQHITDPHALQNAWENHVKINTLNMVKQETPMDTLWKYYVKGTEFLMTPMTVTEQWLRLGEYINLLKQGDTHSQALYKTISTHFDYSTRTNMSRLLELVIPFYNYKMSNLKFWADTLSNNFTVSNLFGNLIACTSDTDQDTSQLKYNRSLEYFLTAGNINLSETLLGNIPAFTGTDKADMTLKTNFSVMDAFNTIANPIDTLKNSLIAPVQTILDHTLYANRSRLPESVKNIFGVNDNMFNVSKTDKSGKTTYTSPGLTETILNNLPIVGSFKQRYMTSGPNYAAKTDSVLPLLLPDVFGSVNKTQPYTPTSYKRKVYTSSSLNPAYTPQAYAKKSYAKKTYAKKTYAKKTYAKKTYAKKSYAKKSYAKKVYAKQSYTPNKYLPGLYAKSRKYTPKAYKPNYNGILYNSSKLGYKKQFYKGFYYKHYTKKGTRRMDIRTAKYTLNNLKYKIINTRLFYK